MNTSSTKAPACAIEELIARYDVLIPTLPEEATDAQPARATIQALRDDWQQKAALWQDIAADAVEVPARVTQNISFGPQHNLLAQAFLGVDIREMGRSNFENRCYGSPTWGAYRMDDGRVIVQLMPSKYSYEYVYHVFRDEDAFAAWRWAGDRMEADPETGRRPYLYEDRTAR
jgi:hypothetical protein